MSKECTRRAFFKRIGTAAAIIPAAPLLAQMAAAPALTPFEMAHEQYILTCPKEPAWICSGWWVPPSQEQLMLPFEETSW